jgi:K+-sensing histidine kinase KdpD
MSNSLTCLGCSSRFCEKDVEGAFNICQYGVSYIKRNGIVESKEPNVPLSTIAKNLRHEINPILQTIIQQATSIDASLSTKNIKLENPMSIIIGSTVILDNFIQMITGVHEFHSSPSVIPTKKLSLKNTVENYYKIYGIIKEEGRTKHLSLKNMIPENCVIEECSDFVQYIIAILVDNAWKYSHDYSSFTVKLTETGKKKYDLIFTNSSSPLPDGFNVFELGAKANSSSKGFGYGLNWLKTLESNYNEVLQLECPFRVIHEEKNSPSSSNAFQVFTLKNIKLTLR